MYEYVSSTEAARILGAHRTTVAKVIRERRLPAFKVANRWLISRLVLNEFARTYAPKRGRPVGWRKTKEEA